MARTTAILVGGLIKVNPSHDLTPFIDSANALVTAECLASGYDDATLELIERWLSAHFYAVFAPRRSAESVGGAVSSQFEPIRVDLGLWNTKYGQQAMMVDYHGNLAALANEAKVVKKSLAAGAVGTKWLGTPLT